MPNASWISSALAAGWCGLMIVRAAAGTEGTGGAAAQPSGRWIGVHLLAPSPNLLPLLKRAITEALAPMGVNVLVFEVNYDFQFQSHPELAGANAWSKAQAGELAEHCRRHGIRLIPGFNCLGHQSWAGTTFPLLVRYPELDETPSVPKDNTGIYCRSWCPLNPKVNEVVFPLLDEIIDAFHADAFHVGMDEVFLMASDDCPRCKGKDPAELFARAVNDLHRHLVGEKKQTMLMWGDRLLDTKSMGYSRWEASTNGTAPAIDQIPTDIILCDWHYDRQDDYPSLPFLQKKGFRVWPAGWRDVEANRALIASARRHAGPRMLGHLFTVWSDTGRFLKALLKEEPPPEKPGQPEEVAATVRASIEAAGGKLPDALR
jgi:glycosyl hydrolase family 20